MNPQTNIFKLKANMQGWVIVYVPGGDIYQLLDPVGPPGKQATLTRRVLKGSVKTLFTCVQLYLWLKG